MVQMRQGIRTTKPKLQIINDKVTEATSLPSDTTTSYETHIKVKFISKMYTDDTGCFPIWSQVRINT